MTRDSSGATRSIPSVTFSEITAPNASRAHACTHGWDTKMETIAQDFRVLTHAITVAFWLAAGIMLAVRFWSAHHKGI